MTVGTAEGESSSTPALIPTRIGASRSLTMSDAAKEQDLDLCVFNGIDATTGKYLTPPMGPADLIRLVSAEYTDPNRPDNPDALARAVTGRAGATAHLNDLAIRSDAAQPSYGMRPTDDPDAPSKLEKAGWGVIFAHDADPAIKDALRELLEWRRSQAGEPYRAYEGYQGYQPNDTHLDWLVREPRRMGPGPADPKRVPYYLLIVGDPEAIPFEFQFQLDVQYAVGRLWFDTPAEYARYAVSMVLAEQGKVALPRKAVLFGVKNPDDAATRLSTTKLVEPLGRSLPTAVGAGAPVWSIDTGLGDAATRSRLAGLLGGPETPALLFTGY